MAEFKRSLDNVLKARAAFQILFSACVHVDDMDAKKILGDLALAALGNVRSEQSLLGVQQVWQVRRGPIDKRFMSHWDPTDANAWQNQAGEAVIDGGV